jgi:hypothetical protein
MLRSLAGWLDPTQKPLKPRLEPLKPWLGPLKPRQEALELAGGCRKATSPSETGKNPAYREWWTGKLALQGTAFYSLLEPSRGWLRLCTASYRGSARGP